MSLKCPWGLVQLVEQNTWVIVNLLKLSSVPMNNFFFPYSFLSNMLWQSRYFNKFSLWSHSTKISINLVLYGLMLSNAQYPFKEIQEVSNNASSLPKFVPDCASLCFACLARSKGILAAKLGEQWHLFKDCHVSHSPPVTCVLNYGFKFQGGYSSTTPTIQNIEKWHSLHPFGLISEIGCCYAIFVKLVESCIVSFWI